MWVLGINGGYHLAEQDWCHPTPGLHDAAAVLLKDGEVVVAIEEERLTRIKHCNAFPHHAVMRCLEYAAIDAGELTTVAISWSKAFHERFVLELALHPPFQTWLDPIELYSRLLFETLGCQLAHKIKFFPHQQSHLWSAFWPSRFDSALVVSLDGGGDGGGANDVAGMFAVGTSKGLEILSSLAPDQSLGFLYTNLIALLGYRQFEEYKIMGLAPHGDPHLLLSTLEEQIFQTSPMGEMVIRPASEWLPALKAIGLLMNRPDVSGARIKQAANYAAAVQSVFERIFIRLLLKYKEITGQKRLCLAGGVAANCAAVGKLHRQNIFDEIFVQPAAGDSGTALGAAFAASWDLGARPNRGAWFSPYLGTRMSRHAAVMSLGRWSQFVEFSCEKNIVKTTAELLMKGKIVAWYQGRSEFGPRALGNRSILADPRPLSNKDRLNRLIKDREDYRPLAPSIVEESLDTFFEVTRDSDTFPYMTATILVKEMWRTSLAAVTHVDGTARVQTVSAQQNPRFWQLLSAFGDMSGFPILLNTSFNNRAEPIVDSIDDAIRCFLTSGVDCMILDDFVVHMKEVTWSAAIFSMVCSLTNYKLVRRNNPHFFWVESIPGGIFAAPRYAISREVWTCLSNVAELEPIGEALSRLAIPKSERLATDLINLWKRRVLNLEPAGHF